MVLIIFGSITVFVFQRRRTRRRRKRESEEIRERVQKAQTLSVVFSNEVAEETLRGTCPAIRSATNAHGTWRLEVSNPHEAVKQVLALAEREDVRIVEINTALGSLEDAFISILQDPSAGSGECS